MKRIFLFVGTNLAIVLMLSISLRVLGVDRGLAQNGVDLNGLLIFAAIVGMSGSFFSLLISKWMAKRMTGAEVITEPRSATERWLFDTVRRLAQQKGIGMPEIAVYDAPDMNAFATGMMRDNALVAVSTGLLQSMNKDEVEAVLGHELSHVANGDMVTLALIQGVVNTFVIFLSRIVGNIVDRTVFKTERGNGPAFWITTIIAELVLGIFATMIVMWFSRWREFRADAGSAQVVGAQKMIAALRRLQANREPAQLPRQLQAFGISDGGGMARLFMSHPPLEARIAALQGGA